jgi:hypothetical protein
MCSASHYCVYSSHGISLIVSSLRFALRLNVWLKTLAQAQREAEAADDRAGTMRAVDVLVKITSKEQF